jgi:hypothetical protein
MTIRPGAPWGREVPRPAGLVVADGDAALVRAIGDGPPVAAGSGDLARTLGVTSLDHRSTLNEFPIDLLHVRVDDASEPIVACAHVIARSPWSEGPLVPWADPGGDERRVHRRLGCGPAWAPQRRAHGGLRRGCVDVGTPPDRRSSAAAHRHPRATPSCEHSFPPYGHLELRSAPRGGRRRAPHRSGVQAGRSTSCPTRRPCTHDGVVPRSRMTTARQPRVVDRGCVRP